MAKEDFCFTYYDGDAARDKAHMTRLQRGAYDDIISAQRKRGHLSIDDIKRVLSKDFDECWPALEWVLKQDETNSFFIEWVDKSIEKMRKNSQSQKERIEKYWADKKNTPSGTSEKIPRNNHGIDLEEPLVNGNGNGNELGFKDGGMGETLEPVIYEPFVINPELPLPDATLEAAELNQFTLTRNKNTVFLQSQWTVFVAERIHDPPVKRQQFRELSDLTTYFLNWVRDKHPKHAKPGTKQVGKNFISD